MRHTELSEVEARAGGRGEAGAGGERGVTSRVLQPAGGVGTQPVAALLMASQLWGGPVSTKTQQQGLMRKHLWKTKTKNM